MVYFVTRQPIVALVYTHNTQGNAQTKPSHI